MDLETARTLLTGFWGPGVRSQGEKGQACRTEEGGDGARPGTVATNSVSYSTGSEASLASCPSLLPSLIPLFHPLPLLGFSPSPPPPWLLTRFQTVWSQAFPLLTASAIHPGISSPAASL